MITLLTESGLPGFYDRPFLWRRGSHWVMTHLPSPPTSSLWVVTDVDPLTPEVEHSSPNISSLHFQISVFLDSNIGSGRGRHSETRPLRVETRSQRNIDFSCYYFSNIILLLLLLFEGVSVIVSPVISCVLWVSCTIKLVV